jgi:hypothetical protein
MLKAKNHRRTSSKVGPLAYLNCDVEDGMFKGEKIVSLRVEDKDVSLIVNSECIVSGERNKLEVKVIDKKGRQFLVGLPGESFSTGRKVWVSKDHLLAR